MNHIFKIHIRPMTVLAIVIGLFVSSCASTKLIKDSDYDISRTLYKQNEFAKALEQFPKKEEKGFITSVEKAWLTLWNKTGDNAELEKQIQSLDSRKYISITKETEHFFFNESEDGYVPAEHEIIALHLINAMIYMQKNNWEDAEVEARRAAYFLQNIFDADQPHFDDPALRLWLAAVWTGLGKWNEAQVDFRRIYELTKKEEYKKLALLDRPPKYFALQFKGSGPELRWKESSDVPQFTVSSSAEGNLTSEDWYTRHQARNTAIRDVALTSNYMAQYLGIKANANTQKTLGYSLGVATMTAGLIMGGVIIGAGIYSMAYIRDIGVIIVAVGVLVVENYWYKGKDIISSANRSADKYQASSFNDLRTYRFVRFLPNEITYQLKSADKFKDARTNLQLSNPQSKTTVEFLLNP